MANAKQATQTQAAPVAFLHVVAQPKHRQTPNGSNARALWWATVAQYNGKPLSAWLAHVGANVPPMQYTARATAKYQTANANPMGWLRHFKKAGLVAVTNSSTPPKA